MVPSPLVSYFKKTSRKLVQVLKKVNFKNDLGLRESKLYLQLPENDVKDCPILWLDFDTRPPLFESGGRSLGY